VERPGKLPTAGQTAQLCGVHPATVWRWAEEGLLPYVWTPGGQRRFPLDAVLQLRQTRPSRTGRGRKEEGFA
jgi:excisionase family DNA binding protein